MLTSCVGEWEHFLYVGKVAAVGWLLHYGASHIQGVLSF